MRMPRAQLAGVRCLAMVGLAVAGCHASNKTFHSSVPMGIAEATPEADATWDTIKQTLRANQFRLDRVDRPEGVITTTPLSSQHFFEFWRHDVDTFDDWVDASINSIRRRVIVTVARDDANRWTNLTVEVRKERFSAPDRQFNSPGAAYEYFGSRLPSTTGKPHIGTAEDQWLDAGRDPAMESYLLRNILEHLPPMPLTDAAVTPTPSAAEATR